MQNNNTIGNRIADLRRSRSGQKSKKMSQEDLAEVLNYSRTQIQRFESGKVAPPLAVLREIAAYFNTTIDYLTGETDIKARDEYCRFLSQCEDEALAQHMKEMSEQLERLKETFACCGYVYEYIPENEFDDLDKPTGKGPHLFIDRSGINPPAYLSEEELDDLLKRINETVAFECFRIMRERKLTNGNG